jgi:hypothetical protein
VSPVQLLTVKNVRLKEILVLFVSLVSDYGPLLLLLELLKMILINLNVNLVKQDAYLVNKIENSVLNVLEDISYIMVFVENKEIIVLNIMLMDNANIVNMDIEMLVDSVMYVIWKDITIVLKDVQLKTTLEMVIL